MQIPEVEMTCHYFKEAYLGFCNASETLHVPSINEMETHCFKDFHTCPIYNKLNTTHFAGKGTDKSAQKWIVTA